MDITPSALRALRATFSAAFRGAYQAASVFYPELTTAIPSTGPQNSYGWMAQLPKMREWLGPRVLNNLITHNYILENKEWELSFSVPRKDIEDDNLGQYSEMSAAHGEAARKHPDELLASLLANGHTSLCFDGQYFFDTDHPVAPKDSAQGTYSNYFTGTALSDTNYESKRAAMMGYKGDGGHSLGVIGNLLVVPPALEAAAKKIVMLQKTAAGSDNPNYGTAVVMVIPELSGADTTWYLLSTQRRIKPFVFQPRRALVFYSKTNMSDDNVVYDREFHYLCDARYNMGYTLPFLAIKAVA